MSSLIICTYSWITDKISALMYINFWFRYTHHIYVCHSFSHSAQISCINNWSTMQNKILTYTIFKEIQKEAVNSGSLVPQTYCINLTSLQYSEDLGPKLSMGLFLQSLYFASKCRSYFDSFAASLLGFSNSNSNFINFHWSCLAVKPSDIENVLIRHTLFVPDHGTSRLTEIHSWTTIFNIKIHWLEGNHLTTAFLKDTMFIHNSVI
jgi:hypothetical protein